MVRKPTLREAAAAYGLRYLDEELTHPCERLQSAIGNSIPGPVSEAFMAQVLQDRERNFKSQRNPIGIPRRLEKALRRSSLQGYGGGATTHGEYTRIQIPAGSAENVTPRRAAAEAPPTPASPPSCRKEFRN